MKKDTTEKAHVEWAENMNMNSPVWHRTNSIKEKTKKKKTYLVEAKVPCFRSSKLVMTSESFEPGEQRRKKEKTAQNEQAKLKRFATKPMPNDWNVSKNGKYSALRTASVDENKTKTYYYEGYDNTIALGRFYQ